MALLSFPIVRRLFLWLHGAPVSPRIFVVPRSGQQQGELFIIQHKGKVYELPCGDVCDGDGAVVETPPPSPGPDFTFPDFTGEYIDLGCAADAEEPNRVRVQLRWKREREDNQTLRRLFGDGDEQRLHTQREGDVDVETGEGPCSIRVIVLCVCGCDGTSSLYRSSSSLPQVFERTAQNLVTQ